MKILKKLHFIFLKDVFIMKYLMKKEIIKKYIKNIGNQTNK